MRCHGREWTRVRVDAPTTCGLIAALCVVAAGSGVSAAPRAANDVAPPATCLDEVVTEGQLNAMVARLEEQNETLRMLLVEFEATPRAATALAYRYTEGGQQRRSVRLSSGAGAARFMNLAGLPGLKWFAGPCHYPHRLERN